MRTFITLILIVFFTSVSADQVQFTAEVSHSRVETGQQFKITYAINARNNNFELPDFSPFRITQGPFSSSSMQIINGQRSVQTSLTYVLVTYEEGTHHIPPAKININGKVYESNAIDIDVVSSGSNDQQGTNGIKENRNVYLTATVDKQEAYVGEKVTVSYKLFSKITLNNLNLEKGPELNGFWSHDIKSIYDKIEIKREIINGEPYNTTTLQQTILYPQRSGTLTIDPMKLKLVVTVQNEGGSRRSFFDQFFGGYEQKEVVVASQPIEIEVKPLPSANKRTDFTGAVGDFEMQIQSNKDSVKVNDAIDLKVVIKGKGNLPFISTPQLDLPSGFEVYDPKIENKYSTNFNGSNGAKEFHYLIIPRHEGDYIIEPYIFSYFDLASKTYQTIASDSLLIHVAKEEGNNEAIIYQSPQKEKVELLNSDIRFIKINNLSLLTIEDLFYGSLSFYLTLLLLVLLLVGVWLYAKKQKHLQADQVGLKKAKANKMANKRLARANKYLKEQNLVLFYEEISAALYGYFSDKFNLEVANLSLDKIQTLLSEIDSENSINPLLRSTLEEAEMARFTQGQSINAPALYQNAVEIISQTENLNKA